MPSFGTKNISPCPKNPMAVLTLSREHIMISLSSFPTSDQLSIFFFPMEILG